MVTNHKFVKSLLLFFLVSFFLKITLYSFILFLVFSFSPDLDDLQYAKLYENKILWFKYQWTNLKLKTNFLKFEVCKIGYSKLTFNGSHCKIYKYKWGLHVAIVDALCFTANIYYLLLFLPLLRIILANVKICTAISNNKMWHVFLNYICVCRKCAISSR